MGKGKQSTPNRAVMATEHLQRTLAKRPEESLISAAMALAPGPKGFRTTTPQTGEKLMTVVKLDNGEQMDLSVDDCLAMKIAITWFRVWGYIGVILG